MGNGVGKLTLCFSGDAGKVSGRQHNIAVFLSNPLDEGLGHSFCYIRPDPFLISSSKDDSTTTFRSISGASISANTSTALSTSIVDLSPYLEKASAFESSDSFASIPLQPIPRNSIPSIYSGPIPRYSGAVPGSGPMERGFLSGPIERSFISGPLENQYDQFKRYRSKTKKWVLNRILKKIMGKSMVVPIRGGKEFDWANGLEKNNEHSIASNNSHTLSGQVSLGDDDEELLENENLQWAQGKAGEDRVHIVVSEENGWVFVGIYDGFNGPDATDFLLNNLYSNIHKELKGLQWNDKFESMPNSIVNEPVLVMNSNLETVGSVQNGEFEQENFPCSIGDMNLDCNSNSKRKSKNSKNRTKGVGKKWEESQRKWRCEWDRERIELDRKLKEQLEKSASNGATGGINHSEVLKALSEGLRKTEKSFLEIADLMLTENPELSLMGSCALVMLMKGEDVYVMNVGDSRAVLAQKAEPDLRIGKANHDLERIREETLNDLEAFDGEEFDSLPKLTSLQLTKDHSTSVDEEVRRIKNEHRDDASAISNDRVKGSLKVTRAFGAGFLKKPKWNNALLEMFRIDYVGVAPYINCSPSLRHHRLTPRDKFLILSSDGLYQYFDNEEAVSEVERFIEAFPEGDPAQHLVEEVLFRAAKKAGMDFHELLDIPQGDRRRYHDDLSIMIISFEGRIWRSSM
ncbi:probable protein phosphatase 2C 23 [Cornus florida]|uniref:probable protein phosphatase 2C 23 n=1 Tax=Cornus florida TaxID=4283 RepID=UPI00289BD452|nr:probable protein phosphatase 2C 23 [Cornus florida]